jgi:phosphohistidine phosphatase
VADFTSRGVSVGYEPRAVPPMKLYLMRHGPAEDGADSGLDSDRALSPSGRDRVRSVAKMLLDIEEAPAQIITSPLVRSVQTAEIVAIASKVSARGGTVEVRRELSPGAVAEAVLLARRRALEGAKRVLLVGHEPDLTSMADALLEGFGRPFDKATVVGLHLPSEGGKARLRFVLDPRTLTIENAS